MILSEWLQSESLVLLVPMIQVLVIGVHIVLLDQLLRCIQLHVFLILDLYQLEVPLHVPLDSFELHQIRLALFQVLILQDTKLNWIHAILHPIVRSLLSDSVLVELFEVVALRVIDFKEGKGWFSFSQDNVDFECHQLLHEHKIREVR